MLRKGGKKKLKKCVKDIAMILVGSFLFLYDCEHVCHST